MRLRRHGMIGWGRGALLAATLAVVAAGPLSAEESPPPTLDVTADRTTMGIADHLRVTLTAEAAAGTTVGFPDLTSRLGGFGVLDRRIVGPIEAGKERERWVVEYVLEPRELGPATVPALEIALLPRPGDAGAGATRLAGRPLTIQVTSILPADADIRMPRPAAPPVSLPRPSEMPWLLLATALPLGLGAAAFWWHRRRVVAVQPAPAATPDAEALTALAALDPVRAAGDIEAAEGFCDGLVDVLRRYLGRRFDLPAEARTTPEILAALTDREVGSTGDLAGVLSLCDLVRFGRYLPQPETLAGAVDEAGAFVRRTAVRPSPEVPAA